MNEHKVISIKEVPDLEGKRVLLRASLNIPVENGKVQSTFRINEAIQTIKYLQERGARTIVLAHIGRDPKMTLAPVHAELDKKVSTKWAGKLSGGIVKQMIDELKDGETLLLENVRSDAREIENDAHFSKLLASYGELYVNDAFPDSHRKHASIVGIPKHLPGFAGLHFTEELKGLSRAMHPTSPSLFILGGAKIETKLPLIEKYRDHYDTLFIGGALAHDLLIARGYEVGNSLRSGTDLSRSPLVKDESVLLPVDTVVYGPTGKVVKATDEVGKEDVILDAGPRTIEMLTPLIEEAKTILWNGPIGDYERGYSEGTLELAKIIAQSKGGSVVGGGDTIAAIESLGPEDKFDFLSTAGGAMLTYLENGTLPGIIALEASHHE